MLDKYTLEKLYEKVGNKLETKAQIRHLCQILADKDDKARKAQLALNIPKALLIDFHPYAISFGTLERMLGRKKGEEHVTPRKENLDRIAHFLGYSDYAALHEEMEMKHGNVEQYNGLSGFNTSRSIYSSSLDLGTIISFKYSPDREIELKYVGCNQFYVLKSINSRMKQGALYEIFFLTPGKSLTTREVATGNPYFCGEQGGIFDVVCDGKTYDNIQNSEI